MSKIVAMALALTVFTCSVAWSQGGQNIPATFFDQQFVRRTDKPVAVANTISVPSMVHGPFTLNVANGDSDGGNRISSARITLNGVQVFGPSDFNENVANLQASVNLQSVNQLTVELASKLGAFIEVTLSGKIDPDHTTNSTSTSIDSSGGTINLAGVGQLLIPPGAVSTTASVEVSTVASPYMDFLVQDPNSDQTMSFIATPKVRIKSSDFFQKPLRLRLLVPNLDTLITPGSDVVLASLTRQVGDDDEAIDSLIPINTDPCSDNAVCATVFPEWFAASNPADPNDPVLQLAVALHTKKTTTFHLWTATNISPAQSSLQVDINGNITFSAQIALQKNFTFQLPLSFLEKPCPISVISRTTNSVCVTSRLFSPRNGHLHMGVDLGTKSSPSDSKGNQDVLSVKSGIAVKPGPGPGGTGERIWVLHDSTVTGIKDAGGLSTFYAHLEPQSQVAARTSVADRTKIATSDATGAAMIGGPHLHFESWFDGLFVDPEPLLRDDLSGYFEPSPVSGEGLQFQLMVVVTSPSGTTLEDGIPADQAALLGGGQTVQDQISADRLAILCGSLAPCNVNASLRMLSPRLGGVRELAAWDIVISRSLTLSKNGSGTGTVTSSPSGINCDVICLSQSAAFTSAAVTLTAVPSAGSVFTGWSGDCSGTALFITGSLGLSTSCIATFDPATFKLKTIASDGGSIMSSPTGIDCGLSQVSCLANFADGTSVTLTAAAQSGFAFTGWSGDCSGTAPTTAIVMNSNKTCSVIFSPQFASCQARFFVNTYTINSLCPLDPGITSFDENIVYFIEQTRFGHSGRTLVELLSQPDLGATFTNLVLFTTNFTITPQPDQFDCEGGFTLSCPHPRPFPPSCGANAIYNNAAPDSISMNFTFFDVGPSVTVSVPSCFLPHCGSTPRGVGGEFCAQ